MKARLLLALSLGTFFTGPSTLTGQSTPGNAAPMTLNVTAVDGNGQPAADLRAEDFQILDNGKPRKIVWFRALPRNRVQAATFILLDLFNADLAARGFGANEITRALERLESADHVYLYLLTSEGKTFPIHGVAAPGAQAAPDDGPWTRRVKPMLDDALRQVSGLKAQDDRFADLRIGPTWQALASLLPQIAEVPGPKSFVWITQGVANRYRDHPGGGLFIHDTAPLRGFADTLNAIETRAYSVQQRPGGSLPPEGEGTPRDTLEQLSALTGGRWNPSDTTQDAIKQAMSDAQRMDYRMAFSPDRLDGKSHKIRVTVARKDIKIQAADRYYAIAEPEAGRRQEAIEDTIGRSPFDYPEIGLKAAVAPVEGAPGQFRFTLSLNAPDVVLLKEGARYKGSLAVALGETGPNGFRLRAGAMPVNVELSEEEYKKALTDGIKVEWQAKLDETTQQVRVVAMDRNSSLAGTVTVPVEHEP